MGLLCTDVLTVSGQPLGAVLEFWEHSERRRLSKQRLEEATGVDPDDVIMNAEAAERRGLARTMAFPRGHLAPEGSVIKATAIDASLVGPDHVYRHRGRVRVFTSERAAVAAVKGLEGEPIREGDIIALIGVGPLGTGMEETYQLTSALKHLPCGKHVAVLTDARFSGVSTGACVGHIGPEALAGGPVGKLRDGDEVEVVVDRRTLEGSLNLVASGGRDLDEAEVEKLLGERPPHPGLAPDEGLPDDTRLWAALQRVSGGTWSGCVYDVKSILERLEK
jgi:dihydroxyacid dehydratase/phosphogluconate dehydratase